MRNGKRGHGLFDGLKGVYECVCVHVCARGLVGDVGRLHLSK